MGQKNNLFSRARWGRSVDSHSKVDLCLSSPLHQGTGRRASEFDPEAGWEFVGEGSKWNRRPLVRWDYVVADPPPQVDVVDAEAVAGTRVLLLDASSEQPYGKVGTKGQ